MSVILKDSFIFEDKLGEQRNHGLWKRTEVIGGYGIKRNPITGLSELDEVIFGPDVNTVTISGTQKAMEEIFGVKGPISVPTLYEEMNIGLPNETYKDVVVDDPSGSISIPYRIGNRVCLFAIGLTGSAENSITKYPVDYREKSIEMSKVAEDGTELDGIIIPFRYTSQSLTDADSKKYFGKKISGEYTGYYLKKFENEPLIKHLWDTGNSDDDGAEITNTEVWDSTRNAGERSLTEMQLKISEKDVKEYFSLTGRIDEPRFNTLALYYADYNAEKGDYANVRLFSKLYIPTENVSLSKDLDLIYRVYTC